MTKAALLEELGPSLPAGYFGNIKPEKPQFVLGWRHRRDSGLRTECEQETVFGPGSCTRGITPDGYVGAARWRKWRQ